MATNALTHLESLSRVLGRPENDYVILGEGNTSAAVGDGTFWVKASGAHLRTAGPAQFVRVDLQRVLAVLDGDADDEQQVRTALAGARVDSTATAEPSIETMMHALCLQCDGVNFVGHTHPTPINVLTCSKAYEQALSGRLFPEDPVTGPRPPLVIPYVDPGLPLARAIRARLTPYIDTHGAPPKTIYLGNHGFVALGATAPEVEHITATAVKIARILIGTFCLGGPHFPDLGEAH